MSLRSRALEKKALLLCGHNQGCLVPLCAFATLQKASFQGLR